MTRTSTTTNTTPEASLKNAVLNQLLAGPTSPEVAAVLLRSALKKMYPALNLDPLNTVVGEPRWDIIDGEIVELPTRYETLSDMVAERMGVEGSTMLIEGVHFLTQLPITTPEVHLPVRIEQIGALINELEPVMLSACQEQQLAYWNAPVGTSGPRWHELSRTLRKIWDVKEVNGWTATECDMARHLFLYPDPEDRKQHDRYDTHAYLIDIDEVDGTDVSRLNENSLVVLIGTISDKEVILAYSLRDGYKKFESQQALGQFLPTQLDTTFRKKIQWRLYEPTGNIFDQKACGLIAMQVKILGLPSVLKKISSIEDEQPVTSGLDAEKGLGATWFDKKIPDWLLAASTSDQILFAQHMKNLSALSSSHAGKTYLDGIAPIKEFALNALKQQMQADHADAATLDPEKIEIQIRSLVAWGSFIVPGKFETTRFNLVELALQNLIALPLGNKTVRSLTGKVLPTWMTTDYIESLITKIDIGRVYPDLVKSKLLDDPTESARREELYTSQLRIQLPMLALEGKIRGRGNIDERGYRYVAALMEPEEADRKVDGQPIVLRRLAFISQQKLIPSEDIVTNMFVIGPKNPDAGPCLLYRPLLEPQLCQYPSSSNLLYAIRQIPELRQSVLAWLPDEVRSNYSRYIFSGPLPSPWVIVEFATDPFTSWLDTAPVGLSEKTLDPDFLPLLFKANANALVELADRQSVSNSETRWSTFKQTGWLIFNLALPYLGAAVGTAVWLWQILDDIETLMQDSEHANDQATWEAFVDLLLNLAMAITTHAIDHAREGTRSRRAAAPEVIEEPVKLVKPKLIIEKLAPSTAKQPHPEHYESIHSSGALTGKSGEGAKLLESFSIDAPETPGQAHTDGMSKGLYQRQGRWYAKVGEKWFNVLMVGDKVCVVDGKNPSRLGPPLRLDVHGNWHIDIRLRLRGTGSKGAMEKVIADTHRRSVQLLAELNRFEEKKPEHQALLTMNAQELNSASGSTKETKRNVYLSTLKTQRESYEEALNILTQWPVFQSRPDAPKARLGYLNAQINFTFEEIDALKERFTPALRTAMDMATTGVAVVEQQHVDAAEHMIRVGEDMNERLDYMETRFSRLKVLGREGFEFIRLHRGRMPTYKSDGIRLIQLDMYRHLCLSLDSVNTMPEGWAVINQLVDSATIAFQSLHDAMEERSVIRLDEQIDAFGSLTEQFTALEEQLEYVGTEYKDSARPAELNRLSKQIGGLKKRALHHLAQALDERSNRRSMGNPYEPRPRFRKKFIRARFWGLVSGEPRLTKTQEETDWVDVKNPVTDKIIATFHRKGTGEWVPHALADTPQIVPPLAISLTKGQALIDGLEAFQAQVEEHMNAPGRSPTGLGMILNAHANRMEKVGIAIKKALDSASNETVEVSVKQKRTAETLRMALKTKAKALYEEAFDAVLNVIKRRPPTMDGVIWLKSRNRISISKLKNRQKNKGPLRGYLDRYEIRDVKENKTLWYADFRYSTDWVPADAYLSGRLKTPEQVNKGALADATQDLTQRQLIDLYRSEIAVDQAREVFFPKRPS